jgi:hypothetical protein
LRRYKEEKFELPKDMENFVRNYREVERRGVEGEVELWRKIPPKVYP